MHFDLIHFSRRNILVLTIVLWGNYKKLES